MFLQYKLTQLAQKLQVTQGLDFKPRRGSSLAAGYDLKACIENPIELVFSDSVVTIPTGVHIDLTPTVPELEVEEDLGMVGFGMVVPRSGLGSRGFFLANTVGIIDADYQGEIIIKARNYQGYDKPLTILPGERIAQLIFIPCAVFDFELAEEFEEQTERGEGGFGSSGTH